MPYERKELFNTLLWDTSLATKLGAMLSAGETLATYTLSRELIMGRMFGRVGLAKYWAIFLFGSYLQRVGKQAGAVPELARQALAWVPVPNNEPLGLVQDGSITLDDHGYHVPSTGTTDRHVMQLLQIMKWIERARRGPAKPPGRPRKPPGSPKSPYKGRIPAEEIQLGKRLIEEGMSWANIAKELGYLGDCHSEGARRYVRRRQAKERDAGFGAVKRLSATQPPVEKMGDQQK